MNYLQVQMYYLWSGWGGKAAVPGPAGLESYRISWTVLRHCRYDRYAALPPISSDTFGIGSGLPSAMARARR